jgi:hypothetical protein
MRSSEECFSAYKNMLSDVGTLDLTKQTEADTRATVITRILREVLDWQEKDIHREVYGESGYLDYELSIHKKLLVVEAKKAGDTFLLPTDVNRGSTFTVGGVISSNKSVKAHIDQVSQYCVSSGIEYATVTNGAQWIIFRATRQDGISVSKGKALVFKGFKDIEDRFGLFWSLLSRGAVADNSLQFYLHDAPAVGFEYKRIVDELHTRNDKVSRNALSQSITPLIKAYMEEIAGDESRELLQKLYVNSTPLSKVFGDVEFRISMALSKTVIGTGSVITQNVIDNLHGAVQNRVTRSLSAKRRGDVVLLLGRVGSGKTTFVDHFLRVEVKKLFAGHLIISMDFRNLQPGEDLRSFFFQYLRDTLSRDPTFHVPAHKNLRKIFGAEIRDLKLGPLAGLEKNNRRRFEEKIADYLQSQYENAELYYTRALHFLSDQLNIRCLMVFDNVDQLDFDRQQEIFTFAHSISNRTHAISLLTMWEETFLRSKKTGALAA